jgi:hypothetical protein
VHGEKVEEEPDDEEGDREKNEDWDKVYYISQAPIIGA